MGGRAQALLDVALVPRNFRCRTHRTRRRRQRQRLVSLVHARRLREQGAPVPLGDRAAAGVPRRRRHAAGAATGATAEAVVETTRAEVQRLLKADWDMADLGLLLRVALFLGAGAAAPTAALS